MAFLCITNIQHRVFFQVFSAPGKYAHNLSIFFNAEPQNAKVRKEMILIFHDLAIFDMFLMPQLIYFSLRSFVAFVFSFFNSARLHDNLVTSC